MGSPVSDTILHESHFPSDSTAPRQTPPASSSAGTWPKCPLPTLPSGEHLPQLPRPRTVPIRVPTRQQLSDAPVHLLLLQVPTLVNGSLGAPLPLLHSTDLCRVWSLPPSAPLAILSTPGSPRRTLILNSGLPLESREAFPNPAPSPTPQSL